MSHIGFIDRVEVALGLRLSSVGTFLENHLVIGLYFVSRFKLIRLDYQVLLNTDRICVLLRICFLLRICAPSMTQ